MAFWDKKQSDFETMDKIIRDNPGIRPSELARRLGVSRSTITRRLPSVEDAGYRYSEDDDGGLWPFRRRVRAADAGKHHARRVSWLGSQLTCRQPCSIVRRPTVLLIVVPALLPVRRVAFDSWNIAVLIVLA